MGCNFVNLTPHVLDIVRKNGTTLTLPPSGWVARVAVEAVEVIEIEGVEITSTNMGALEGLEGLEVHEGDILITSLAARSAVKAAYPGGVIVTSPGALIRKTDGQPAGCQGLAR